MMKKALEGIISRLWTLLLIAGAVRLAGEVLFRIVSFIPFLNSKLSELTGKSPAVLTAVWKLLLFPMLPIIVFGWIIWRFRNAKLLNLWDDLWDDFCERRRSRMERRHAKARRNPLPVRQQARNYLRAFIHDDSGTVRELILNVTAKTSRFGKGEPVHIPGAEVLNDCEGKIVSEGDTTTIELCDCEDSAYDCPKKLFPQRTVDVPGNPNLKLRFMPIHFTVPEEGKGNHIPVGDAICYRPDTHEWKPVPVEEQSWQAESTYTHYTLVISVERALTGGWRVCRDRDATRAINKSICRQKQTVVDYQILSATIERSDAGFPEKITANLRIYVRKKNEADTNAEEYEEQITFFEYERIYRTALMKDGKIVKLLAKTGCYPTAVVPFLGPVKSGKSEYLKCLSKPDVLKRIPALNGMMITVPGGDKLMGGIERTQIENVTTIPFQIRDPRHPREILAILYLVDLSGELTDEDERMNNEKVSILVEGISSVASVLLLFLDDRTLFHDGGVKGDLNTFWDMVHADVRKQIEVIYVCTKADQVQKRCLSEPLKDIYGGDVLAADSPVFQSVSDKTSTGYTNPLGEAYAHMAIASDVLQSTLVAEGQAKCFMISSGIPIEGSKELDNTKAINVELPLIYLIQQLFGKKIREL